MLCTNVINTSNTIRTQTICITRHCKFTTILQKVAQNCHVTICVSKKESLYLKLISADMFRIYPPLRRCSNFFKYSHH